MNDSSGVKSYLDSYNTFSGCDMTIVINIPLMVNGNKIVKNYVVGEIQTLTYSTHMNRQPIRSISNVNAKDYVMGQRSIAGTMVFSVFDNHFANRIIEDLNELYGTGANILVDELPPFDINIVMANEYGHNSNIVIYGVRFINEGQVMSINDIYMENTYQYVATGIKYADNTKHNNKYINENRIVSSDEAKHLYNKDKEDAPSFPFDDFKKNYVISDRPQIIYNQDIDHINRDRPNHYDDISNKFHLVSLNITQHEWVGNNKEVSFLINQSRETGYIIISNIMNKQIAKLSYEGINTLYALPEGGYYARYTDIDAASNTEYFVISKSTTIPEIDEKPTYPEKPSYPEHPGDNGNQDNDLDTEKDNPIIEDIEDDNISVTENDAIIRDIKNNEYYPDRDGYVYGLKPNTKYDIFYKKFKFTIVTEPDKNTIYNRLKESLTNKFKEQELELKNILYELEYEIYNNQKDILESVYFINEKYKNDETSTYNNIIEYMLLNTSLLIQNKKTKINNNSNLIPQIENYYSNRVLLNDKIVKITIHKYPYNENEPYEVYKEDFINKNGKKYYYIKDPNRNLYKIVGLNKNGIKIPSVYLFTGIGNGKTISINNDFENKNIEEVIYNKNKVKINKNIYLPPELEYIDSNYIKLYHDNIEKNDYIVCCPAQYINNPNRKIRKRNISNEIIIDRYEIDINEKDIYLAWIENNYEEVLSSILVFVLDRETNNKIKRVEKSKIYSNIIKSEEYKELETFTKQIVLKVIEDSEISWNSLKTNYTKSFVENIYKYSLNIKHIMLFDILKHNNMYGVKRSNYKSKINKYKDRIFLDEEEFALIDVICRTTGKITRVSRSKVINLSYFKNNILIINIFDDNTAYRPFVVLPFNNYEVI